MRKESILPAVLLLAALSLTAQTVTVTSPNGGESWPLGTPHAITWNSTNAGGAVVNIASIGGLHVWWYGLGFALGFWQIHRFIQRHRASLHLDAREAFTLAAAKLPLRCTFVARQVGA